MKKIISIILCALVLALTLSACFVCFADDETTAAETTAAETTVAEPAAPGEFEGDALYSLGLIKGMDAAVVDYGLATVPTRGQAIVMVVRFLGAEKAASDGTWTTPFDDVPDWAKPYIGYAYTNGITQGKKAADGRMIFDTDAPVLMEQFLTFILRVLGYKDTGDAPDFKWDAPYELAASLGLVDGKPADGYVFTRADVMKICYAALSAKLKDGEKTLSDTLIETGVISSEGYARAAEIAKTGAGYQGTKLSAEETTAPIPVVTNVDGDIVIDMSELFPDDMILD